MGRRSREVRDSKVERLRDAQRQDMLIERALQRGCLICRRTDGGFTANEHTIGESVGNRSEMMPKGVVCDRCNHGPLSVLDQTIGNLMPIKVMRTLLGVPSKQGQVPITRLATGTLRNVDGGLRIDVDRANDFKTVRETGRRGDQVELQTKFTGGRRLTPRYAAELSAALLKSALECAWLDHGDRMYGPEFDHVRAAILGEPREGFIALLKRPDPNDVQLRIDYDFARQNRDERLWVIGQYYVTSLFTDSRLASPAVDPDQDLIDVITFTREDFRSAA